MTIKQFPIEVAARNELIRAFDSNATGWFQCARMNRFSIEISDYRF